jgi:hypothetical protein
MPGLRLIIGLISIPFGISNERARISRANATDHCRMRPRDRGQRLLSRPLRQNTDVGDLEVAAPSHGTDLNEQPH